MVSIYDDVEILGLVFHGLKDISEHVKMSLYRSCLPGLADARDNDGCNVYVGELWMPYPCFDASDYATENMSYQNFVFRNRPITEDDLKALSDLPTFGNEYRVYERVPAEMRPLVYYEGDGQTMLVAK